MPKTKPQMIVLPPESMGHYVSPKNFIDEIVQATQNDPGCEVKCMLFYLVDPKTGLRQGLNLLQVQSEARCMSIDFVKDGSKPHA